MDLTGVVQYVAGVLTGGVGTTLFNHWLSTRRDVKQAERDREAEDRAEARGLVREQRSRDLARIQLIREVAIEWRESLARDVFYPYNPGPLNPRATRKNVVPRTDELDRQTRAVQAVKELHIPRVEELWLEFFWRAHGTTKAHYQSLCEEDQRSVRTEVMFKCEHLLNYLVTLERDGLP